MSTKKTKSQLEIEVAELQAQIVRLEEQRKEQNLYRYLFENNPHPMWVYDLRALQFLIVNNAAVEKYGYSHEEFMRMTIADIRPQKEFDSLKNDLNMLQTPLQHIENRQFQTKHGEIVDVDITWQAIQFEGRDAVLSVAQDVTRRNRASEALRQSEKRLRDAQAIGRIGDWEIDLKSGKLYYSDEMFELLERDPALGAPEISEALNYLDPQECEIVQKLIQHAMQTGIGWERDSRIVLPSGREVWYRGIGRITQDEEGGIAKISGIAQDITKQIKFETRLLESEIRFRQIAESIEEVFWIFDNREHRISYISPAYEKIWGRSTESLHQDNRKYIEAIHPQDRGIIYAALEKQARGEKTEMEYRILQPDGNIRCIHDRSFPIFDKDGTLERTAGIATDVTESKAAEDALKASEEKYRTLFRTMAQGVVYQNTKGEIIGANSAAEHILGLTMDEMTGRTSSDPRWHSIHEDGTLYPGDTHPGMVALRAGKAAHSIMGIYNLKTDSYKWVNIHAVPQFMEGESQPYQVYTTFEDITELKQAERNNTELVRSLGKRLQELSALHSISRIFMDSAASEEAALEQLMRIIPPAMQYPEVAAARITYNGQEYQTDNYESSIWSMSEIFRLSDGKACQIEIVYLQNKNVKRENPFLQEEIYLFQSLVEQCKSFLSRKAADRYIERRSLELNQLLGAGRALSEALTAQGIYGSIYKYIKAVITCDMLLVASFDSETELITCEFLQTSQGAQDVSGFPTIPLEPPGRGTQSVVIRTGQSLLLSDYQTAMNTATNTYAFNENGEILEPIEEDHKETEEDEDIIRSAMIVPLIIDGKSAGALQVFSFQLDSYTEDHLNFVEALAFRVSAALSNAQLLAGLEKRVQERTAEIEIIRQRLELATQAAELGVWDWDVQTGKLLWDDQMHVINGSDKNKFTGEVEFAISRIHPNDKESVQNLSEHLVNGLSRAQTEFRIIRDDDGISYIKTSAVPVKDSQNRVMHIIGVSQDVTQEKLANQALRESEEIYRALFEYASDAIFLMDMQSNFISVNPHCQVLLGTETAEELIGRNLSEFTVSSNNHESQIRKRRTSSGIRVPTHERVFIRKDGKKIETDVSLSTIRNAEGKPQYLQALVRDITEQKQNERNLRESEDRMRRANLELERAMRMKDEFLASMSHELRTPLTGVLGLSEALQMDVYGALNEKQKKALINIETSGRHLLELINDILDISKIEAGKLDLQMQPCALNDICQSSLHLVKGMAGKKQQRVNYTVQPAAAQIIVRGDVRRLKQIFVNLLSNAIKFTPDYGNIGLEISTDKNARAAVVTVWDEGIGISTEDTERIFHPFVQVDSSLARQHTGTGLGLALVKKLLDMHQGEIHVESQPGKGSRFTVTLPCLPADAAQKRTQAAPPAQKQLRVPPAPQEIVMVVDDNAVNVELLEDFLSAQNFKTVASNSAQDFLAHVEAARPNIILMDIQMPEINGLEAIRRLRALPDQRVANIPVIAITALAMPGDRETCLNAGANEYMVKPIKLQELIEHIQKLTGAHHERQ